MLLFIDSVGFDYNTINRLGQLYIFIIALITSIFHYNKPINNQQTQVSRITKRLIIKISNTTTE